MARPARYTPPQIRFLQREWPRRDLPGLTAAFNAKFRKRKSRSSIRAALANHGIKCGRPPGNRTGTLRLMSPAEAKVLGKLYQKHTIAEAVRLFNKQCHRRITTSQGKTFVENHDMHSGRTGCFEKGLQPWNKGTKGVMKPNSGNFKKGQMPATAKPLGFERIDTKDGYIHVKIAERNPHTGAPTRFKPKHVHVWEQKHGPIPDGHCLRFKDDNKQNCAINNLVLVTRRANALLNKKFKYGDVPPQFRDTIMLAAKLEARAGARSGGLRP